MLAVVGLRDKVIFLAARSEVYGTLAITYLFIDRRPAIVAAQLVMVAIWWGAATSKLNRHFPYVVAAMMSNSPVWRFGKRQAAVPPRLPRRPAARSGSRRRSPTAAPSWSSASRCSSCSATAGSVTKVAAVVMICFHLNIITSLPMGVPLEWNVFMIIGILNLFVAHADGGRRRPGQPAAGDRC